MRKRRKKRKLKLREGGGKGSEEIWNTRSNWLNKYQKDIDLLDILMKIGRNRLLGRQEEREQGEMKGVVW